MSIDIEFVESFYKRLEEGKIDYCILRNVEEVINGDAHDIDMVIDSSRLIASENILFTTASDLGWKVHIKTGSCKDAINIKCYHLFKISENKIHIVHFDFFPTFSWNGYVLIDNKTLLANVDKKTLYHTAAPEVEAVTKLFVRLLHNGYIKSKYKRDIVAVFCEKTEKVNSILKCFLDDEAIEFVNNAVYKEQWKKLEENRGYLVKTIKRKSKKEIIKQKIYLVRKAMGKAGIMIAFEGTDGSGKSTIIDSLPGVLGNSFPEGMTDYYHWRPGFIKKEKTSKNGEVNVVTEPHAKAPYGKIKSFAKFMFLNLDYFLGYWCNIRWEIAKGHLVIFDRYYYDYYLDKLRYRLNISDKILDLFKVLIPKPDITFILVGDPQTLYERKREISVQEIQAQIERLLKNKNKFNNSVVIDVNKSVEDVVKDVSEHILETCVSKVGR